MAGYGGTATASAWTIAMLDQGQRKSEEYWTTYKDTPLEEALGAHHTNYVISPSSIEKVDLEFQAHYTDRISNERLARHWQRVSMLEGQPSGRNFLVKFTEGMENEETSMTTEHIGIEFTRGDHVIELLIEHSKTYGFDFNPEYRGILHFYGDKKEYDHAEKVNELYKAGGLERNAVAPEDIGSIEPALAGGKYVGGFFTPSDFTGDIHRYTVGLATGIEKEGVKFKMGTPIERVYHHGRNMVGPKGFNYGVGVELSTGATATHVGLSRAPRSLRMVEACSWSRPRSLLATRTRHWPERRNASSSSASATASAS